MLLIIYVINNICLQTLILHNFSGNSPAKLFHGKPIKKRIENDMTTMIEMIKNLRQETNAGILDCRQALEQSNATYATALSILREKAIKKANEQSQRESSQGVIELYSHGKGRIGVMVEVNCETDFTALTTIFRDLAHEIALQIAATAPRWVNETDIAQEILQ
jgi:elongation factor Ts